MQKSTCEKVHVHVYFSKILQKLKVVSSYIYGKKILSRNKSFFLNKNLKVFKIENRKFWAKQNHALKITFRKTASNKQIQREKRGDI